MYQIDTQNYDICTSFLSLSKLTDHNFHCFTMSASSRCASFMYNLRDKRAAWQSARSNSEKSEEISIDNMLEYDLNSQLDTMIQMTCAKSAAFDNMFETNPMNVCFATNSIREDFFSRRQILTMFDISK